jgi:hypothetical protein|tara:strand:- start:5235 stop:5564 length:330 start_codon:yes stop_codon:yes gene_type:complete
MAKRVDKNHKGIVLALRDHPGVSVFSLADLGKGIPDICIGYKSFTVLAEIKSEKGRLNPLQTEWHFKWTGTPVVILRDVGDIEELLKTLDKFYVELGHSIADALLDKDS